MRLDPFIRDYRGFMAEFLEAVEAEGTLFYLDTSLLMWLLHIAPKARGEFIRWCEACPNNVVRVPVWAAHEMHRHLIDGTVRSSVQKVLNEVEAKYDDFVRLASERADDAICLAQGYAGRTSYINQVERSLVRLREFKSVIDISTLQLSQAAEEVITFINAHVLSSDIRPLIDELSRTGEIRFSHRIPPGFHDKKQENRFGDVIIWEEIIGDLLAAGLNASGQPRNVILISRDHKTDWVSSAPLVLNLKGFTEKSQRDQELDVTMMHPLLVHEFASRAQGKRIYVTPPGFLASAIDFAARQRGQHHHISQWLAASHQPRIPSYLANATLDQGVASADLQSARAARPAPAPAPPHLEAVRQGPQQASLTPSRPSHELTFGVQDAVGVMSEPVAEELRLYREAVPLEQRNLVVGWVDQLRQGVLAPFKLGRVLAELSVAGVPGWSEQLEALIAQLTSATTFESLNSLVLALITSAYFDRYGQLLRRPHGDLGRIVLSLEGDERLKPAFSALNRFLSEAGAELPHLPGADRRPVSFSLDLVEGGKSLTVRDIRIGKHSALVHPVASNSSRSLTALLARTPADRCTGLELRMLSAREFLIPPDLMDSSRDNKKLTWFPEAGLVTLDMESEGGLGTFIDEEDEDGALS